MLENSRQILLTDSAAELSVAFCGRRVFRHTRTVASVATTSSVRTTSKRGSSAGKEPSASLGGRRNEGRPIV